MKHEPHKSSVLDLDANIVVLFVWILPLILFNRNQVMSFLGLLIPFAVLLFEKKSSLVRQHAGQVGILMLALSIIYFLLSFISTFVIFVGGLNGLLFYSFGIIAILIQVITWILTGVLLVCTILACMKGYEWKEWRVPVLEDFGDILTRKVKFSTK